MYKDNGDCEDQREESAELSGGESSADLSAQSHDRSIGEFVHDTAEITKQARAIDQMTKDVDNIAPNISIFDNKEFSTTDECAQYMAEKFGFFVPDLECLVDLEGLLVYLGEKVKLGGYCLFCPQAFASGETCQKHMITESHCKLRYESGVDKEEYEEFYEHERDADSGAVEDNAGVASTNKLIPESENIQEDLAYREQSTSRPVLDQLRAELLRLGSKFGDRKFSAEDLVHMEDAEVIAMLVKYQQDIRRSQMTEQRLQQRAEEKNKRLEFKDRKEKARTSKMVAEKISSYHGMLM